MEKLIGKLQTVDTNTIKEVCISLKDNQSIEANISLEACLNVLELRLSESDFVGFCETL